MTEERDIEVDDWVMYDRPHMGTMGHTGKVVAIRGKVLSVEPTGRATSSTGTEVVEKTAVLGWWPKGSRFRSAKYLRRMA